METESCQHTQEIISDITNELMLKIGSKPREQHGQLFEQFDRLNAIKKQLIQWQFGLLSDKENILQQEAETKRIEIDELQQTLEEERQIRLLQLQQYKNLAYKAMKDTLNLKQTEQLKKNYEYLTNILDKLKQTKLKEVDNYHSQRLRCSDMKQDFQKTLPKVYEISNRIAEEYDTKSNTIKQQNQILEDKIKEVKKHIAIQESKQSKINNSLQYKRHNTTIIQRQMNYNVLSIESSNKKLGESDPIQINYKELIPKYSYKNQAGIYVFSVIVALLVHYVIF